MWHRRGDIPLFQVEKEECPPFCRWRTGANTDEKGRRRGGEAGEKFEAAAEADLV